MWSSGLCSFLKPNPRCDPNSRPSSKLSFGLLEADAKQKDAEGAMSWQSCVPLGMAFVAA